MANWNDILLGAFHRGAAKKRKDSLFNWTPVTKADDITPEEDEELIKRELEPIRKARNMELERQKREQEEEKQSIKRRAEAAAALKTFNSVLDRPEPGIGVDDVRSGFNLHDKIEDNPSLDEDTKQYRERFFENVVPENQQGVIDSLYRAAKKGDRKAVNRYIAIINDKRSRVEAPEGGSFAPKLSAGEKLATGVKELPGAAVSHVSRLGRGVGELLNQDTEVDKERQLAQEALAAQTAALTQKYGEMLRDPNLSPTKRKRIERALAQLKVDAEWQYDRQIKRAEEVIDATDPVKGAAAVAELGFDVLTLGTGSTALKAGKAANKGRAVVRGASEAGVAGGFGAVEQYGADVRPQDIVAGAALSAPVGAVLPVAPEAVRAVRKGVNEGVEAGRKGLRRLTQKRDTELVDALAQDVSAESNSKLTHYTSPENAKLIKKEGFKVQKTKAVQGDGVYLFNGERPKGLKMGSGNEKLTVKISDDARILDLNDPDYKGPSPTSGNKLKRYAEKNGYHGATDGAQTVIYDPGKLSIERPKGSLRPLGEKGTAAAEVEAPVKPTQKATAPAKTKVQKPEIPKKPRTKSEEYPYELVKEYADMLEDVDKSTTGGQLTLMKDGTRKRTTGHSKFYREFFAEHGRKPGKKDWMAEAKRQIDAGEADKDFMAYADEIVQKPEPKETILKPIGEGKTKTSKVSKRIETAALKEKLVKDMGDLPEYKRLNMADQAEKAAKLLQEDEARAIRIARGLESPPNDVLPESVFIAVEDKAFRDGDSELIRKLANSARASEATAMGQRISAYAQRNPDSPVAKVGEVVKARKKAAEKRLKKPVDKAIKETTGEIKKTIKKPTKTEWSMFVESIKC